MELSPCTKTQLSNQCQQEVLYKLNGHPVDWSELRNCPKELFEFDNKSKALYRICNRNEKSDKRCVLTKRRALSARSCSSYLV